MKTYTASIAHTEDSIQRLMKNQYLLFNKKVLALQAALCVLGLTLGLGGPFHLAVRMAFLFLGCWMLPFVAKPGREAARQMIRQLNGVLPSMGYTFYASRMLCATGGKETAVLYSRLIRLTEDERYYYLFQDDHACYMVDKQTLRPREEEQFRKDLEAACGLEFARVKGIFTMSLQDMLGKRK